MKIKEVVIVGGGPSGLATAACLNILSIPNVVLEKEHCYAHLWKCKAYDRLKLHLGKEFCALPHMQHEASAPTYIPKDQFVRYLDEYVQKFNVSPVCNTLVESAVYDDDKKSWNIKTRQNTETTESVEYMARFLVVATGENAEGFIPNVAGLKSFNGEVIHSSEYKTGKSYEGKNVLVVGCGNSGMEIAYDLANFGAKTSIVIRSPVHVMTKELIHLGMVLAQRLPIKLVDYIIVKLSWIYYGNLSKYGIVQPHMGPLALKAASGRSAVLDVGTVGKIKSGEIKVVKEISTIKGNEVEFIDGKTHHFDSIVFATGYRSTAKKWLKDEWLLNEDGFPKEKCPNHWKGKNGLYCVGLARKGLFGVAVDAEKTANDIAKTLNEQQ